ncbi:MAG: hypothetical protein HLUCCA12_04930 [Rhodobacteraceae bacterium HLUCCA12]|nr:MAG: hypothetical protein HLUCCA12_04930 [Rhodobacteraceae bacterium HLUCCA12]
MFEWIRRLARQDHDLATISALGERDLSDMGVSREQALNLAAMPRAIPARVQAMGRVFDLDADALQRDRAQWVNMVETCAECPHTLECRSFLSLGDFARPGAAGFCPNSAAFRGQTAAA